jgi:N-methylhydantoinase B
MPATVAELSSASVEVLAAKAHTLVDGGDVHVYLQTGGGGYGDPLRREPERVLHDVRRGLVSPGVARSIYGVVIGHGAVDAAATMGLRAIARADRLAAAVPAVEGFVRPGGGGGGGGGPRRGPPPARQVVHPVGDTVQAIQAGSARLIACSVCHTRFGAYGEDYKAGTVMCELRIADLGALNAVAPPTDLVVREFYCPGCGTAVALDIQAAGEPMLAECTFAT